MSLTDQLRRAIRQSELSGYAICKQSGVDKGALSRFLAGKVKLSAASMDAICTVLRLELVRRPGRGGPK